MSTDSHSVVCRVAASAGQSHLLCAVNPEYQTLYGMSTKALMHLSNSFSTEFRALVPSLPPDMVCRVGVGRLGK